MEEDGKTSHKLHVLRMKIIKEAKPTLNCCPSKVPSGSYHFSTPRCESQFINRAMLFQALREGMKAIAWCRKKKQYTRQKADEILCNAELK